MRLKVLLFTLCICCALNAFSQRKAAPARIIFDSDMGPDYDDVGAITILHALADKGEAKILATMASTKYDGVAGVLNIFNTYFNYNVGTFNFILNSFFVCLRTLQCSDFLFDK